MADFGATELETFRAEARAWLEENCPKSLRRTDELDWETAMIPVKPSGDAKLWSERIGRQGLGHADLAEGVRRRRPLAAEARVLQQEMARIGADNPIQGMGPGMFGPTLLEYGTEEQKLRHLPPISRGEHALVPGLFRARRRLRPRLAADQVRGQGRPLGGQRPEDLDQRRAVRRLVLLPGAHRPEGQEARGHLASC